ncbi:hypothetical protein ANCCEY_04742 [Ancylostoma ceylanicum]|uniref:Uncharacterized protein n=1 Tax=Ancylostoma ceylanicum TaxID=53326 RepID=A0A0D6M1C0_9BILA|nr:hypothetical protein ANCCEY_04742 [Ancylostoma ceylanicum]
MSYRRSDGAEGWIGGVLCAFSSFLEGVSRSRMQRDNPLLSIACGQFALSLMQAMFMFYYVKIYLNIFRVPQMWFNIAQTLFMFWNAVNDPLFGYMQDKPGSWMNSRTRTIRSFAPFLVSSFVFMWIPWSEGSSLEGIHLVVSLFLYDAFYSVEKGSLLAEGPEDDSSGASVQKGSVAHMNFASTATELLIPQSILPKGSLRLSLFYGVLTLGPQLLLIFNERVVVKHGAYRILMASYVVSFLSGLLFLFTSNPYLIIVFMFIDSVTVHSAAPLFNIVISDFIDDDVRRHSRKSGLSSLVFSLNALIVKPAQSIAPVLVVYILNGYGYEEYISSKESPAELAEGMRVLLMATPLVLGGLQYFIFKSYSLRNKHVLKPEEEI